MIDFKRSPYAFNIHRYGVVSSAYTSIMLLSGNTVDLDSILNGTNSLDVAGATTYSSAHVIENLEDLGAEIVSVSRYSSGSILESYPDELSFKLDFNLNEPENSGIVVGTEFPKTINQCILACHSGHANLSGYEYTQFMVCSVGLVGSGADVEVSTLELTEADTKLHFSAITFKF